MRRSLLILGTALGAVIAPVSASAAIVVVDAKTNSITGGTGVSTGLTLSLGQALQISASPLDLWSAGIPPRQSNANGLIGNVFAVAGDDSGQAPGTLIGQSYAPISVNGFSAPFGALVGRIGTAYQVLGTSVNTTAWAAGSLELFFWDNQPTDNTGSISVSATVPEPATWALMMAGFGILGFGLRRRPASAARVSFNFS